MAAWKRAHGEVRITHAETDALEFAAEAGIVGIACLCLLAIAWWGALRARLTRGRDPYRRDVAVAAACAAGALLVHSLFDFGLRLPALAIALASLLGVAAAPPRDTPRVARGRIARLATAGAMAALALCAGWRAAGAWRLDAARRITDPTTRVAALGAALRAHPYLPEAWRERASALRGMETARARCTPRGPHARRRTSRALSRCARCGPRHGPTRPSCVRRAATSRGAARRSTVPARSIPRTCRWGSRTRTSSSGSTARARPSSSWSGSGR